MRSLTRCVKYEAKGGKSRSAFCKVAGRSNRVKGRCTVALNIGKVLLQIQEADNPSLPYPSPPTLFPSSTPPLTHPFPPPPLPSHTLPLLHPSPLTPFPSYTPPSHIPPLSHPSTPPPSHPSSQYNNCCCVNNSTCEPLMPLHVSHLCPYM